jgi:F0F1-type ATP synthase epsilon subunit
MPESLKVKIWVADRTVYEGKPRTIALRFFKGRLEVMPERNEYYASFDRGTITLSYGSSILQYDLALGFASYAGTELTVLAGKAKKIAPPSRKIPARPDDQGSAEPQKKRAKYAPFFPRDA